MASGELDYKYVDYSTVAMGLFGAAAGIPTSTLLAIENSYAKRNSRFVGVPMSAEYPYLPRRNVYNTELGYKLFGSWKPK